MPATAYLKYSHRDVVQRSGGRYEYTDEWHVPNILAVNSPDGDGTGAINRPGTNTWMHEALNATNLPQIGDQSQDGGMVVVSLSPHSQPDQGTAVIDVRWQEDPLTLPTEVHYFSETKIKPAWRGYYTAPGHYAGDGTEKSRGQNQDVVNAAGDHFNPPVTYQAPLERIEVFCHVSLKFHDTWPWADYLNKWNSAQYTVKTVDSENSQNTSSRDFPIGTLFLANKRAPEVKEPYLHRALTLTFLYDPDGFGVRVLNAGPRCFKNAAGFVYNSPGGVPGLGPVTDAWGNPFGGIGELDTNGNQIVITNQNRPAAEIDLWWPITDNGDFLNADFTDLDIFSPERTPQV